MVDQPFASSEIGESMDADLLPELSGETWLASSNVDLITASRKDAGVDSVRMGGVCGIFSGITLLAVTSRKFVHCHRWQVMAATSATRGGLKTGGPPE